MQNIFNSENKKWVPYWIILGITVIVFALFKIMNILPWDIFKSSILGVPSSDNYFILKTDKDDYAVSADGTEEMTFSIAKPAGATANPTFRGITITFTNLPAYLTGNASSVSKINTSDTWNLTASDAIASGKYIVLLDDAVATSVSTDRPLFKLKFGAAGTSFTDATVNYTVSLADADFHEHNIASASLPLKVGATPPPPAELTASVAGPVSLTTGQEGTWTVTAQGGTSPYQYAVLDWKDGTSTGSVVSSNVFKHTYATAGSYSPIFQVIDQAWTKKTATATVIVSATPPNTLTADVTGSASLTTVQEGNWTVTTQGGTTPYQYAVQDWGDGTSTGTLVTTNKFTHTYATAGTYNPIFAVIDTTQAKATDTVAVIVTAGTANTFVPANITVTGSPDSSTIFVRWDPVKTNQLQKYNIYRCVSGASCTLAAIGETAEQEAIYYDTTATSGQTYVYAVTSVVSNEESAKSANSNAVTAGTNGTGTLNQTAVQIPYSDNSTISLSAISGLTGTITWTSSNPNLAEVDATGKVKINSSANSKGGIAYIKATGSDGKYATAVVEVWSRGDTNGDFVVNENDLNNLANGWTQ